MGFDVFNSEGDEFEHHCLDTSNNIMCDTYVPEQLKGLNINNTKLSILHLNIRSLNKHHDELVSLLSATGCNFDIIGISETWLNDRSYIDTLNIEGYKLFYENRVGKPSLALASP